MSLSKDQIISLIHDVFLPPAVPQGENQGEGVNSALIQVAHEELREFASSMLNGHREVEFVASAMGSMRNIHSLEGYIRQNELQSALTSLKAEGAFLVLHVRAQNAGVVISKLRQDYLFELFELSPTNSAAMTTLGRLRRHFPAKAMKIPETVLSQTEFTMTVARTLAKMSHQPVAGTRPKVRKARQFHDEDRDTRHPGCVTELFTGFLGAIGELVDIDIVAKNTRENVAWKDARAPWRRSPVWLLIRVALQLAWRTGADPPGSLYKNFMVFFISRILQRAQQHDIPSDTLFVMHAKLERRMRKLGSLLLDSVRTAAELAMMENENALKRRWSDAQAKDGQHYSLHGLATANFHSDTRLDLSELDRFVSDLEALESYHQAVKFMPPSNLVAESFDKPPSLDFDATGQYGLWNIQRFETWVVTCLDTWCKTFATSNDLCREIGKLIIRYHNLAVSCYDDSPEGLSTMLLTIFDLWIAGDQTAIKGCNLLQQFDPALPSETLQNLLLPFRGQMQQLSRIEKYLADRRSAARHSMLLPANDPNCFAAKYFDQSEKHRKLRDCINDQAHRAREHKLDELARLQSRYKRLIELSRERDCEYREVRRETKNVFGETRWVSESFHVSTCRKCDLEHQADALEIDLHEWPLPQNATVCKTVVFELDSPAFIRAWRDTTMYVLLDVLKSEHAPGITPRANCRLTDDAPLGQYLSSSSQRVILLSEEKPHIRTHRKRQKISTTSADEVCVHNGQNYRYHDDVKGCFIQRLEATEVIPQCCTLRLEHGALQPFIFRPARAASGPPHNAVIASQADCPPDLALEEYIALCSIPLGNRIQWLNVLRELAAPSIDLKTHDSALIIWQCIYQAGPGDHKGGLLRESHATVNGILIDRISEVLDDALQRLKGNWDSASGLGVLVSIAARVLALHPELGPRHRLMNFLSEACEVCFAWVETLRVRAQTTPTHAERVELLSKCVEVALVCASCFNLEGFLLESILRAHRHASILIQCSIIICNGGAALLQSSDGMTRILSERVRRLLYRGYRGLSTNQQGIHDAIAQSWSAYRSRGDWVAMADRDHWLVTETAPDGIVEVQTIHYNLLTGELLVDGLPLGHLPHDYKQHPLYAVLFGRAAVEVMPSPVPGMRFSTKADWNGYDVHLGLRESQRPNGDLLVRASNGRQTFFVIPSAVFGLHVPESFVEEFVHWLNPQDRTVEFRPVADPWNARPSDNWVLHRKGGYWELSRAENVLVGSKSPSAKIVGNLLAPLASSPRIHITLRDDNVNVAVPTSRIAFLFRRGSNDVYSKQYPGTVIDTDQSVGTLIGMKNKLVLREKVTGRRSILVPEGPITWNSREKCDVWVDANHTAIVHHYTVNSYLGRLDDNGSLHTRLYLAFLHALTSFCLPDPLTGRTGAEQALSILNSAAVMSIHPKQADIDLLEKIANLSPRRTFYPSNERVMESIEWDSNLGVLAQRPDYHAAVASILAPAEEFQTLFLKDSSAKWPRFDRDEFLDRRARLKYATICVSGFGAEEFTTALDASYAARDSTTEFGNRSRAQLAASLVYQGSEALAWYPPTAHQLWDAMCLLSEPMVGPDSLLEDTTYQYDGSLLQDHGSVLARWMAHRRMLKALSWTYRFDVMIWLSSLVFSNDKHAISPNILQLLALFYADTSAACIEPPAATSFDPSKGYVVLPDILRRLVRARKRPFGRKVPEEKLQRHRHETDREYDSRRQSTFKNNGDRAVNEFVTELLSQELSPAPHVPCGNYSPYIEVKQAMISIQASFQSWSDNLRLFRYMEQIAKAASVLSWQLPPTMLNQGRELPSVPRNSALCSIQNVFEQPAPTWVLAIAVPRLRPDEIKNAAEEPLPILESLVQRLRDQDGAAFEQDYIDHLLRCINHYEPKPGSSKPSLQRLSKHRADCESHVRRIYDALLAAAHPSVPGMLVPRWSPVFFLEPLSRARWNQLPDDWKACVVAYGIAITALQRADRVIRAAALRRGDDFVKELRNPGHGNWDPMQFPDSLLLEIESDILIRDTQETIARQMRHSEAPHNAVMQLNMGEGKSSVIMPIVAAALANGDQLVRIIVPRPQLSQMAQMLCAKLGGMLNRRIHFLPVTRDCRFDENGVRTVVARCQECQDQGGILLHQPEDLLSLQLMGPESFVASKTALGLALCSLQRKLDGTARDLVDESDEVFSVKFELIYTMGTQRAIELSPRRWHIIQQVFSRVLEVLPRLCSEMPLGIETLHSQSGRVTRFHITQAQAGDRLVSLVARSICETGLDGFPITRQPASQRAEIYAYLTRRELTQAEIDAVENRGPAGFCTGTIKQILMLLRGLLAGGVLAFVLSRKRWRVDYGLAPDRTPVTHLAVPFAAKDVPTPRSEFSHPEVVMLLTSLCYYYHGLGDDELLFTFRHLLRADQSDIEYEAWVRDAVQVPPQFRHLQGVNLRDRQQCSAEVFPLFRTAKSTVDYYLNIVFSKEMKEFPHKLSASGWDVGKSKGRPTTGFSGTNDSRELLPLDVKYLHLPSQQATNALVLSHLLVPENEVVDVEKDVSSSDAESVLATVQGLKHPARVILDAGAQILELTNVEVAEMWLRANTEDSVEAVVFFYHDDLSVIDRHGFVEPFQVSSYASRLEACLVYLDQAHTRGTDLKLPLHYRAAVTLGDSLTKDQLAQACMRMRQLGNGQTITFCVPSGVRTQIERYTHKPAGVWLSVEDVLVWSIRQTWTQIRRSIPLWETQGRRFDRQRTLWNDFVSDDARPARAQCLLEEEAQSLQQRYRPVGPTASAPMALHSSDYTRRIEAHRKYFGEVDLTSGQLSEEQVRELAPEIEEEPQLQRAQPAEPAPQYLHPDVERFARDGAPLPNSAGYTPAFAALHDLRAAETFQPSQLIGTGHLLASTDFIRTVQRDRMPFFSDDVQRPVQWVLSSRPHDEVYLMIISPFEAQQLIERVRRSFTVDLHPYKPRVQRGYCVLDRLDYLGVSGRVGLQVPQELLLQLSLFSGQLYFDSLGEYKALSKFLGLQADVAPDGWVVASDGFVLSDNAGGVGLGSGLETSPVPFLKDWICARRKGQGIKHTHMGQILDGTLLRQCDFTASK